MATQELTCMYVVGNCGTKSLDIFICLQSTLYHSVKRVHNHIDSTNYTQKKTKSDQILSPSGQPPFPKSAFSVVFVLICTPKITDVIQALSIPHSCNTPSTDIISTSSAFLLHCTSAFNSHIFTQIKPSQENQRTEWPSRSSPSSRSASSAERIRIRVGVRLLGRRLVCFSHFLYCTGDWRVANGSRFCGYYSRGCMH